MNNFDPNVILPQNVIISSAENNLYRIGLCLTSKSPLNRNKLHNPLLIFIVNSIVFIKCLISLLIPNDYKYLFIIIGDFSYFLGIKIHFNIAVALYILLAITSQLIYYYNYKNDIKPTFLKVFEMMSGLVSPKSIGLTNEKQIYKLINLTKKLFFICELFVKIPVPLLMFITSNIIFIINFSVMDIIIFGIPNSLLWSLCVYYIFSINVWQVIYFYIICSYIKIKIKELNEKILIMTKKKILLRKTFLQIIHSLNSLYSEINEYNTKFWSKYLLSIWLIMGSLINSVIFMIFFSQINKFFKIPLIYGLFILIITFLLIINTSSSVNYEANKSYKLLNSLMVSNARFYTKTICYTIPRILAQQSNNAIFNSLSNKFKVK